MNPTLQETAPALSLPPRTLAREKISEANRGAPRAEKKSPWMFVSIIGAYLAIAWVMNPRLIGLFGEATWWLPNLLLVVFIFQVNVFWLYGCFYVGQSLFSLIAYLTRPPAPPRLKHAPPVAILYTTLHDFQEEAVLSCIHQDYPNCHTFILDDSRDEEAKAVVDDFARRHPEDVTVVRRTDRKGFKAGNINNALKNHVHGYEYFAIADADSVFPKDFIASLLSYFRGDEQIGFVQGAYRPAPEAKSRFAKDLELQVLCMWAVYCRARNRFGSVIFLGHGGIVRYDVWEKVGGFPEIISEDLAFAHRAARLGYRGQFVNEVFSYEEFPENYTQFRKQQKRYIQGACQYLHREFWPYLCSGKVRWFEKLDTVLTLGGLIMPVFFFAFILMYCMLMPVLFGVFNYFVMDIAGVTISTPVLLLTQGFFDLALAWDYLIVTAVCTLAPTVGALSVLARHPIRGTKMVFLAAGPYMSLLVMASLAVLSYLVFRTARFTATGDKSNAKEKEVDQKPSRTKRFIRNYCTEDSLALGLELVLGVTLAVVCVVTLNFILLAFSVAILMAPLLARAKWESRLVRPFLYLPFFIMCAGLAFGASTLTTGMGAFMSGFVFRF